MATQIPRDLRIELAEAEDEVSRLKEKYLRAHGWAYDSHTPGSYWMWKRNIPGFGQVAFYRIDDAMKMQDIQTPADRMADADDSADMDCHSGVGSDA